MKTLKKNNISQGSSINSPVPVNKNCDLPPFFNPDYFAHVVVQTLEELESIPCKLRQDGMVATVVQEDYSDYQLQTSRTGFGICDNNAWVKISIGDEVFNGGNLFLFQTEEQANEFMGSTQSKEGQIIYISDLDRYFKFDGQDGLTDAFPNKLDKPTEQGGDNTNYKIPAYLDGKPYWRSSSDFGKVDTVNGIEPDGNKNMDLGIDDILPKGMPLEETLDDNKKVLLYDDRGKSYWKSLSEVGKVKSVNGKTGDVVLKTSDLQNDSDYTTNAILTAHTSNKTNPHNVTKSQIGLGDVDNTSDLDKPISTDTQNILDKKIDKPTINNTNEYVLLADGSTAPKSDFGKVDKVMGVAPDANKNVDFSGVALNWTNASHRMSALVSKHNDTTYNRLLGMDNQGNLNEVGIYALISEMLKATDAQKDLWRNASRKSNETTGATVPSITAVNAITLGNNAGFNYPFSVLGVNLNLVQHVNLIKVKDEQGQLIPEELVSITNFTRDSATRITIEYPTNTFTNGFIVVEFVDSLYYSVRSEEIEVSDVIKSLTPPVVNWSYIGSTNRIQTNDVIEGNKITLLHNSTDSNQFTNRCNYETNPFITRDMVTQGFEITFKTNFVFKNANRIIDGYPPIGIYLKTSDNIDFLTLNQDDIERMRYDSAFYKINTIQTTIYRGGTFENSIQNYLQQSYITIKYKNGLINIIIYYEDGTIKNFKRSLYVPPSSSIVSGGLKVAIDIGGNFTPYQNVVLDRSIEIIDFKLK